VSIGGNIPQEFYLKDSTNFQDFTSSTVGRGSDLKVDVEVHEPGSVLKYAADAACLPRF
jgi:hypothetical protein